MASNDLISFARGAPSADLIPVEAVRRAATAALADDWQTALSYGVGYGHQGLREWLAEAGVETALPHDHDGPDAGDVPGAGHAAAAYTLDTGLPTWVMEALKAGARAGIFAQVNGERLQVLTEQGDVEGPAEAIALAVRNPSAPDALVLLVLASDQASLEAFLQQISPGDLSGHVGVYLSDDAVQTLPAGAGS